MEKILVIGGGSYQVPLIKRIIEMGYEAYCIDKNQESKGFSCATGYANIDVLDRDACLQYAREIGISGVMTYGATLTLPTVSYIGERLGLPTLPMETAEISRSKYKIKKRLAELNCNIKGTFFEMHSMSDAKNQKFELPCVIKPCDGSGSKGVSVVKKIEDLDNALRYADNAARYGEFYCESYISGEEYSVEAFICYGEIYIYGIVKTTFIKNGYVNESIEYGHRTPSGLSDEKEKEISNEIIKAIRALNITMASVNFDVIVSDEDEKPYVIDCGIRVGQNLLASHLIPLSRGVSIIDNTIKLAINEKVDATPKCKKCIATRLLIYNPGTIREIKPIDELIGNCGIIDVVLRKDVGERQQKYNDKSDTCGWVICTGEGPCQAEENAEKARYLLKNYIIIE